MLLNFVQIALLTLFIILLVSLFVCIPSTKLKANAIIYPRVFIQLLIALLILLPNFGQDWEVGSIESKTQYKSGSGQSINATIGINIGIRSINVSLKADSPTDKYKIIYYNEEFYWSCNKKRFLIKDVQIAKRRGSPKPIIWVMEYFTAQEKHFKYGETYCIAGRYCQFCMWSAFIVYLIALAMFKTILSYGTYFLAAAGIFQLLTNLLWATVRNPLPVKIYFEDGYILTKYGFSFWLCISTGTTCVIIALVLFFMEYKFEKTLYMIFDMDPVNCCDEVVYLSKQENSHLHPSKSYESIPLTDMEERDQEAESEYEVVIYKRRPLSINKSKVYAKISP